MAGSTALWGRAHERELLDGALDSVRGGESVVLVLRGEAGVGKTALLTYLAAEARDCRVSRIAGVESELELPFAALHQMCRPALRGVEKLPAPQARALEVAFGLAEGETPDRFAVGLAVLGLLAEAASERPLVCLVDDAQWLDQATCQVLGVAARRLVAESVLLLFAVREVGEDRLFPGLPETTVNGLEGDDARSLLSAAVPGPMDAAVRDRLVAETHGNPLALLELARATSEAELAGGFGLPATATISGQLHEHYLRRIRALPDETRRLMLLAAADPTGDATLLWRAAHATGIGRDAAVAAEAEHLLELSSVVRFRHPLVRSAAYAAGSSDDRRAAHLALATATDGDLDPDRRVWHQAAAATGSDGEIATALERAADRAQARAGVAAAAAFLQRSVALTAESTLRAERALAAAHALLHAGAFDAALGMLAEAEADAVDDLRRARGERLRAEVDRASTSGRRAPVLLAQAAERLASLDPQLARETYLGAWGAALVAAHLAEPGGTLREVSTAARSAPTASERPTPGDWLLDGLVTLVLDTPSAASASLRQAVDAFLAEDQVSPEHWLHWGTLASDAALALWDIDSWIALSARHVEVARASGALAPLAAALNVRRGVETWCGEFEVATALGIEEQITKEVTGTRRATYGGLLLAGYLGHPGSGSLFTGSASEASARGEGLGVQIADRATVILNIGLGHYAEALEAAERSAEPNLGPFTWQALPDLIEAAARVGKPDVAADALDRLRASVADGSDWGGGLVARGRALLADGEAAEAAYVEALERLDRTPLRPEIARTRLLYGEWLRRDGRRLHAREQLRAAHEAFADLGAEAFADRARRELLATGEKVRKRQVETLNDLTPQEAHIARMARDGRTNPEIASELFISTRTVEWHLRKVFGKLGIGSRKELQAALPGQRRAAARV